MGKIGVASPDLDAAITKLRNVFVRASKPSIEVERSPFELKGRDLLAQRCDARGWQRLHPAAALSRILAASASKRDHGPKRLNGALRLRALSHVAANAANAVEPAQLRRFDLDFMLDGGVSITFRRSRRRS